MIDPWFNLFIFSGIAWFIFYLDPSRAYKRTRNLILSAVFFGLAVLTKGPVALLIFGICFLVFLSVKRFRVRTSGLHLGIFLLVLVTVGGSWFLFQILKGNSHLLRDFITYQFRLFSAGNSVHRGFFGYHFVVLFLGVFPASVIALKSFTKKSENTEFQRLFRQWMYILFWVVLIFFSVVKTKLLHYSSLAYFPLTFLAAWVWEKWIDRKIEIGSWQVILIFLIALFHAALAILFPLMANHHDWLLSKDFGFLDPFARAALQRDVHWSGYEWLIGPFLILGVGIACIQILRRYTSGMLVLHLVVLLFVTASLYTFTGRIEGYTQRAAIKFYQGLKGQEVYVKTLGFKSFAHLFYYEKKPGERNLTVEQLMEEELDRDAYFVFRIDKKELFLERYPDLEVLHEKDGYVFTVRRAEYGEW